jgi:DNA-binding NarL/FixJ family response regulator
MASLPEEDGKVERLQMVDSRPQEPTASKPIRIYLAEEQEIPRKAFQSSLISQPGITLAGSSPDICGESLVEATTRLKVHVMVLGTRVLHAATIDHLELLRDQCPNLPVILLSAAYAPDGLKALRQFTRGETKGCAYLLKHTVDTVEQLAQVVHSVAVGRVILDPVVMVGLVGVGDAYSTFLKELTPLEMQVLSWIARGYHNQTIAGLLSLELKTVERHVNSIYSKLGVPAESKHPRVQATLLYMRAVGLLPGQQAADG